MDSKNYLLERWVWISAKLEHERTPSIDHEIKGPKNAQNSPKVAKMAKLVKHTRFECLISKLKGTYLSGGYGFLPNWSMTGPPPLTMRSNQPSSLVIVNPSLGNVVETLTPINPMPDSVTT